MEPLGIYSPLSGITTNQLECFNTLLKRYEQWREAPLDSMILGLYFLQMYYHNEVQRGYGGIGSYSLLSQYAFAAIPLDEIKTSTVLSPEEIVDKIKNIQIGCSSIDFSESNSTEELHGSHVARSSDPKSAEKPHESHAAHSSEPKSTEELHGPPATHVHSSDPKSTEESQTAQSSDPKSAEESHAAHPSEPKSTEELHESHATHSFDPKSTEESQIAQSSEVHEPDNTSQYARAR